MIRPASISWRFLYVWKRNLLTYQKIWKVNFLTPLVEPLLYITAFGLGLGGLISNIDYAGLSLTYTAFIAPALIATAVMQNAFFETTYASFVRMYYQKTFDGMLATPLSIEEIIIAEIVWSATKATCAATIMIIVLGCMGFIKFPSGLLLIPAAFIGGLAFGSIGLTFTGIVPSVDMFNLPIFLFMTPMFLFSGTFFPVSNLPDWAQIAAQIFPLYHMVELTRNISLGLGKIHLVFSLVYLLVFFILFTLTAMATMKKRLIK